MNYGCICSGIEVVTDAWGDTQLQGEDPREVKPFPSAVE